MHSRFEDEGDSSYLGLRIATELLIHSQNWDKLKRLLTNVHYMSAKTIYLGIDALLEDYTTALFAWPHRNDQRESLERIFRLLKFEAHIFRAQSRLEERVSSNESSNERSFQAKTIFFLQQFLNGCELLGFLDSKQEIEKTLRELARPYLYDRLIDLNLGVDLKAVSIVSQLTTKLTNGPKQITNLIPLTDAKSVFALNRGYGAVWNIETGKYEFNPFESKGDRAYGRCAALSTDGRLLYLGTNDGSVQIRSTNSWKLVRELPVFTSEDEIRWINTATYNKSILVGLATYTHVLGEDLKLVFIDPENGSVIHDFRYLEKGFSAFDIALDGSTAISATHDAETNKSLLQEWRLDQFTITNELMEIEGRVSSILHIPNTTHIVICVHKTDGTSSLERWSFDLGIGKCHDSSSSEDEIRCLTVGKKHGYIAAGLSNGSLAIWSYHELTKPIWQVSYSISNPVTEVKFIQEEDLLISVMNDGSVLVWDWKLSSDYPNQRLASDVGDRTDCLLITADSNFVIAVDGRFVRIFDIKTQKQLWAQAYSNQYGYIVQMCFVGSSDDFVLGTTSLGNMVIFDMKRLLDRLQDKQPPIISNTFESSSSLPKIEIDYYGAHKSEVRTLRTFGKHRDKAITLSPWDGLTVWDWSNVSKWLKDFGEPALKIKRNLPFDDFDRVYDVQTTISDNVVYLSESRPTTITKDGRYIIGHIATVSQGNAVLVWDTEQINTKFSNYKKKGLAGTCLTERRLVYSSKVDCICVSPTQSYIVLADPQYGLVALNLDETLFLPTRSQINTCTISPDGRWIVASEQDGMIHIVEVINAEHLKANVIKTLFESTAYVRPDALVVKIDVTSLPVFTGRSEDKTSALYVYSHFVDGTDNVDESVNSKNFDDIITTICVIVCPLLACLATLAISNTAVMRLWMPNDLSRTVLAVVCALCVSPFAIGTCAYLLLRFKNRDVTFEDKATTESETDKRRRLRRSRPNF